MTTIGEVMELMTNLSAQTIAEGKRDAEKHDEYACVETNSLKNKQGAGCTTVVAAMLKRRGCLQ